jgi:hypothetical protein
MMCVIKKVAFASKVMKNSQLMDNMLSLHFIDFISWGVLDNGPLYCITLCVGTLCLFAPLQPRSTMFIVFLYLNIFVRKFDD